MKAIVHDAYGSPDVLRLREIERPVVGDDEVLVRVHAAGLDQGVWHIMAGLPYPIRLAGYGLRAPKNPVPGSDAAGRVEAVGENVNRFQPGDEVFGTAAAPSPSMPPLERTGSRPSRRTSASSRPPPSPSRATPPSRPFATRERFGPVSGC